MKGLKETLGRRPFAAKLITAARDGQMAGAMIPGLLIKNGLKVSVPRSNLVSYVRHRQTRVYKSVAEPKELQRCEAQTGRRTGRQTDIMANRTTRDH